MTVFAAIYDYPTVKCFVICTKDRLPDRHSCLNLHPCVIKFSQSVSQSHQPCCSHVDITSAYCAHVDVTSAYCVQSGASPSYCAQFGATSAYCTACFGYIVVVVFITLTDALCTDS